MQMGKIKQGGQKLIRVEPNDHPGLAYDIYVARPETWATLLLIRTGSAKHNIILCKLARQKSMVLHADGSGLFHLVDCEGRESRAAGDTEESIFLALGLKFRRPDEREC